jgi:hypothetical protein
MKLTSFPEVEQQIGFLKNEILRLRKQSAGIGFSFSDLKRTGAATDFSTTTADVPNCSIILPKAGIYLITAIGEIYILGTDRGILTYANIGLMVGSVLQTGTANVVSPGTANINYAGGTVCQQWNVEVSANTTAKLRAWKTAGAASQSQFGANTSISALWVGE